MNQLQDQDYYKKVIIKQIELTKDKIIEVSKAIHSYAEVGMKEFKSSKLLADELEKNGFSIERGIAGMPTAFKASFEGGSGPAIAFLAEYDALPQMGHACGHNIIGTSTAFAGIALTKIIQELGGTVLVYGTPDEEGPGGKITMLKAGVFKGVDVVITNHPFDRNCAWWPTVAVGSLKIEFVGKPAHYATPHKGRNALDAAIMTLTTLNILRHGFRSDVIFGYVISEGGLNDVIVPERAKISIAVKSVDANYLAKIFGRIKNCVKDIAKLTGVKANLSWVTPYFEESIPNLNLIRLVSRNFQILKVEQEDPSEIARHRLFYSTDYGNVSKEFPGVNLTVAIGPKGTILHTPKFAQLAVSKQGCKALLTATKVMAMTAIDLLTDPRNVQKAKEEFTEYKSSNFTNLPLTAVF